LKFKIATVKYLNALPFTLGLKALESQYNFELIEQTPSECTNLLRKDLVDLALIPVGSLTDFDSLILLSDYCIACDGEVRTVKLFSNYPVAELDQIILDTSSRSSNLLIQILCKELWGAKKTVFHFAQDEIKNLKTGYLYIGDKVFELENGFTYEYDLGKEWKRLTGLPFVFAVWTSRKEIPQPFIESLNQAFQDGLRNFPEYLKTQKELSKEKMASYFKDNIEYKMTQRHKLGMQNFFEFANLTSPFNLNSGLGEGK
jgi:chorismate dehydratase